MKSLVFALSLVASFAAQAVTLHQCVIKTRSKLTNTKLPEQIAYVANATGNTIRVSENTVLRMGLPMKGLNADVYVNDQLGFIFKGDLSLGSFESAFDSGTIICNNGVEVGAVYSSSGVTSPAVAGTILASCYHGDAGTVASDLQRVEGFAARAISVDSRTGAVRATRNERACLKGHGTNVDDYVCEKWGTQSATYTIQNCDYNADPR